MLLAGPVTVTGPDMPKVAERVQFLDAVAALLPYGYRASLNAASWSDTGAGARFRIVFANRARDEASRLAWGAPARVPAEGPARSYLEYLRRITAQPTVDPAELARLIGHLSRETSPGKFEQPERAVASLTGFFRAATVLEALDAGNAETDQIWQVFDKGEDQRYTPERRRELFGRLIAAGRTRTGLHSAAVFRDHQWRAPVPAAQRRRRVPPFAVGGGRERAGGEVPTARWPVRTDGRAAGPDH